MDTCIFCQIAHRKAPAYLLYQNRLFTAFLDIHPRGRGHTLIIPNNHYTWVYDVPEFTDYWACAHLLSKAIIKALNPEYISFVTHGIEIPHAHIHIVPHFNGERRFIPDIIHFPKSVMEETAVSIRSMLTV